MHLRETMFNGSTWKMEENHQRNLSLLSNFEDENFCCWGECNNILKNSYGIKTNLEFNFRDK